MGIKLTNEIFIEGMKTKYIDNCLDYSLVDYRDNKTKVKLICEKHGEFFANPNLLLHDNDNRRFACIKCLNEYKNDLRRIVPSTKTCSRCKREKSIEEFDFIVRRDKHKTICKECRRVEERTCNLSTEEKALKNKKIVSKRNKNKKKYLLIAVKLRAKKKGLEFNIDENDFNIPEYCPVLNIKLINDNNKRDWNSPSLDRIDNAKGYVKGNVMIISWRANNIKNNGTAEEHRKIADYIDKHAMEQKEA